MKIIEGDFTCHDGRYAIVVTRFNAFITQSLLDGAVDALRRHGIADAGITVVWAPGAYELPLVVKKLAQSKNYDAIIALGAVIRGGTAHFEYVAGEASKGVASAMLEHELPVAFGVLTVESIEQAIERAGTKAGNKGAEAALTAIEMVSLLRKLGS